MPQLLKDSTTTEKGRESRNETAYLHASLLDHTISILFHHYAIRYHETRRCIMSESLLRLRAVSIPTTTQTRTTDWAYLLL